MDAEADESPAEVVGIATYVGDDEDVIAAFRAARILGSRWYDTWPTWLAIFVVGHALVLLGVVIATLWALGLPGNDGEPIPFPALLLNIALGLAGAWLLYARVYGYRRNLTRRILDRPEVPSPVTYEFTNRDVATRTALGESRNTWAHFREVAQFRDGFVLAHIQNVWEWIPNRAFRSPFDPEAAASYFRERAPRFVEIGRAAGLPGGPARDGATVGPIATIAMPAALGTAAYVYDEAECHAAWAAQREFVEVPLSRKMYLVLAVLFLAGFFGTEWAQAKAPPADPTFYWGMRLVVIVVVLPVVWLLGRPSGDKAAWKKWLDEFPLRGGEMMYEFDPSKLSRTSATGRVNLSWPLVRRVVESADGFYLITFSGGEWVPNHALRAPFRPEDLAALLRSKVRSYRVDSSRVRRILDLPA